MDELNTKLVKAMTRPTLKAGVPVQFLVCNLFFWALIVFFGDQWNKYPVLGIISSHIAVMYIMIETPSFFHQVLAYSRCKIRNFRRGAFGGVYYSPINYKKSLNYSK